MSLDCEDLQVVEKKVIFVKKWKRGVWGGLGDGMMEGVWLPQARYRGYSPLRETPREYFECLEDCGDCQDELFLLPERALDMDSYTLREDLSSIVPSYRWETFDFS